MVYGEVYPLDLIIDTQILSYRFKGVDQDIHSNNLAISSITANEFLLAQPKDLEKPNYYIIHPSSYGHGHRLNAINTIDEGDSFFADYFKNPKWARTRGTRRTDQVIIDFGNQFSAYREFGNEAISEIINKNKPGMYKISIAHLPKNKQKYLVTRLKYILNNGYYCYPLTDSIIEQALSLFSVFTSEHNCKGEIRNTVNDILILATAIDKGKKFLTYDNLLGRFAAKHCEASIHQGGNTLLIDFSEEKVIERRKNKESKGYINRGWSYAIRNN